MSEPSEFKDRLEFPLEFLESMRGNFLGSADRQTKSLSLLDSLADAIHRRSAQDIQTWIEKIDIDTVKTLGSAFWVVYQFATNYLDRCASGDVPRA